jgi:predicted small metal-binding protein
MYEVSCRDLGLADCDFVLMAHSLKRLERGVLAHARFSHPELCDALDAAEGSAERKALRRRIAAAAREVVAV